MSVLLIVTYDVTDPEKYAEYNPGSLETIGATIAKHGGAILVAEADSEYMVGDAKKVTIVLRFPSADAAKAWHEDPEYLPVREIRLAATDNITALIANEMAA